MTHDHARVVPDGESPVAVGALRPTFPVPVTGSPADVGPSALATAVAIPDGLVERLAGACASVTTDTAERVESGRDWWPASLQASRSGRSLGLPAVVARPADAAQVAAVLRVCNEARVPVTPAGGRSGVEGGAIPLFGGVALDLCGLTGLVDVDDESLVVDVRAGMFGDLFEHELRTVHRLTAGHWPQSINLSTVGGWLACRGAGQFSNRYGKIEDIVVGLDVALADGSLIATGGHARAAAGPDLNQLFVGSEGTLGVITGARLRVHPAPRYERRAAFGFTGFAEGLDACRRILRRGLAPAVLRLYDGHESRQKFKTDAGVNVLLALDEGDRHVVDASMTITAEESAGATRLDSGLVEHWLHERNDVSNLGSVLERGFVYDTVEVTGAWRKLPAIYTDTIAAIAAVEHTLLASSHQSHAYSDGACLYFTFVGQPPAEQAQGYYAAAWEAATRTILAAGGNLSHHHGVGLNRARFMCDALGAGFDALVAIKRALDPNGILNPGKLGFPSSFGRVAYP